MSKCSAKILLFLFLSLWIFAPAALSEVPETVPPPATLVPVFFASDRQKLSSNADSADSQLADLSLGSATVILPSEREWFESGSSQQLRSDLSQMGWTIDSTISPLKPFIEVRGYVAEPYPDKVITNIGLSPDFWMSLTRESEHSKNRSVYVYIHGFAASGNNSVYAGGILSAHLEAPVVVFSWPSEGTAGLKPLKIVGNKRMRARFERDKQMIDNDAVMGHLSQLIRDLRTRLSPDTKIYLVAHSLGNRLMARYFTGDAKETVDGVYFVAADVDKQLFMSALPGLRARAKFTVVFENPKDLVLKISGLNNLLGLKIVHKLGDSKFSIPNIEFIDYSEIAEPKSPEYLSVQHYLPFEHFGSIVRTGAPYLQGNENRKLYIVKRSKIDKARN